MITFDVANDWRVTVDPSSSVEIGPHSELTVTVLIPCPHSRAAAQARQQTSLLQEGAGSVAIIDVEGYIGGDPVGGIEILFAGGGEFLPAAIALPIIFKQP